MFHLHSSLSYYLYPLPVDMRKSFYTLSGIVTSSMNQDVRSGGVFIFVNRNQTIMKILHMEYAGMVIYYTKLDSRRFNLPVFDENTPLVTIKCHDLISIIQRVKLTKIYCAITKVLSRQMAMRHILTMNTRKGYCCLDVGPMRAGNLPKHLKKINQGQNMLCNKSACFIK
jgi:transposase